MTKIIICKQCDKQRPHSAFGLCKSCHYKKWLNEHREERKAYCKKWSDNHPNNTMEWRYKTGRSQSMTENKQCGVYLGCYITEPILMTLFDNVQKMPNNHKGYDFISDGIKIDAKSSCRRIRNNRSDSWVFHIDKNIIADQFILLAINNRDDIEAEHIWLIPGSELNMKSTVAIFETNLIKWNKYSLDNKLDQIKVEIDKIKGDCKNG